MISYWDKFLMRYEDDDEFFDKDIAEQLEIYTNWLLKLKDKP